MAFCFSDRVFDGFVGYDLFVFGAAGQLTGFERSKESSGLFHDSLRTVVCTFFQDIADQGNTV